MFSSLEIPIEDLTSACIAGPYADRLEVCDELDSDGWSPSAERLAAIVEGVSACDLEVVALIRPRCCPNFTVSSAAVSQARADIEVSSRAGADGVVLGFLNQGGNLDPESSQELAELAHSLGLSVSLHRVFDFDEDYDGAVQLASECGFERILTSGNFGWGSDETPLESRILRIKETVQSSIRHGLRLDRVPLRVVACGGIRACNASQFLTATADLHASCRADGQLDDASLGALVEVVRG